MRSAASSENGPTVGDFSEIASLSSVVSWRVRGADVQGVPTRERGNEGGGGGSEAQPVRRTGRLSVHCASSSLSTAMNAFWLISTLPIAFIRFLPSFCF